MEITPFLSSRTRGRDLPPLLPLVASGAPAREIAQPGGSGESSRRNDLGRIYTIKFWLTNGSMHVKSKNYRTTNKNQDITFS
jgi:hypothetical protein